MLRNRGIVLIFCDDYLDGFVMEEELSHRKALVAARTVQMEAKISPDDIVVEDSGDIREMCRSAVPGLVRKAVRLAAGSDSLREVLDVLKEVADRGYGKAVGEVHVKVTTRDEGVAAIRDLMVAGLLDAAGAADAARDIGLDVLDVMPDGTVQ